MNDSLSFKIFKLLKIKNINQKELSKKTGIKQSSLSRILSNKYKTKTETLQKIAKALNISVSELLEENNPLEKDKNINSTKQNQNIYEEKLKIKEEEIKVLKDKNNLLEDKIKFFKEKIKSLEEKLKTKK